MKRGQVKGSAWWVALGTLLLYASPLGGGAAVGPQWQQVVRETFDSPAALAQWRLEGAAEARVTAEGQLEIRNRREKIDGEFTEGSVLWYRTAFWGDVRIEFTCHAEPASRVIFFFNTQADNPKRDIFVWDRPGARYGDYAYEPRLELYTLGLLRSDQSSLNLRRLGGPMPREWIDWMPNPPNAKPQRYLSQEDFARALCSVSVTALSNDPVEVVKLTAAGEFPQLLAPHLRRWREINASFQKATIIAQCETAQPVFADPSKSYRVAIEVVGDRVRAWVDGQQILDHVDKSRASGALRGGYFGFRNFRATAAWYDEVGVYQPYQQMTPQRRQDR